MLGHKLFKSMIAALASVQLLVLQIATPLVLTQQLVGSSMVYASDDIPSDTSDSGSVTGAGAETAEELSETYEGLAPESKSDMITFIMMLIIGFLAAALMQCRKKTIDMIIAAVGGAIYIAGELMQFFQSKAKFEQEEIEYTVTETGAPDLDEAQREAFMTQREGYVEAKKAAELKGKIQMAAGVAFFAAAGVGVALGIAKTSSAAACVSGGSAEAATGNAACTAAVTQAQVDTQNDATLAPSETEAAEAVTSEATSTGCASCGFFGRMASQAAAACTGAFGAASPTGSVNYSTELYFVHHLNQLNELQERKQCLEKKPEAFAYSEVLSKVFEKVLNSIFPPAYAEKKKKMNPLLILFGGLGGGIALVMLLKRQMGEVLEKMIGTPIKRGIAFAALGGLALASSKMQKKVADQMQQNIDDIDAILNRFENLKGANQAINGAINQGTDSLTSIPLRVGTPLGTDGQAYPCVTTSGAENCVSTKKLLDAGLQASEVQLPSELVGYAGVAGNTADSLSGQSSLTEGAAAGIDALSKGLNAVNRINRALKKKLNDELKKGGNNPINFAKAEGDLVNGLKGSMLRALKRNNMTPMGALGKLSPNNMAALAAGRKKTKEDPKKKVESAAKKLTAKGSRFKQGRGFNLDLGGDSLDLKSGPASPAGLSGSDEDILGQDINYDSDADLFKIISIRYIKSGYPRVLELKE